MEVCETCNSNVRRRFDTLFGRFSLCDNIKKNKNGEFKQCLSISYAYAYAMPYKCYKCSSPLFKVDSDDNPRQVCFTCDKTFHINFTPRDFIAQKQAKSSLDIDPDTNESLDYPEPHPRRPSKSESKTPPRKKKIRKERRSKKKRQYDAPSKYLPHSDLLEEYYDFDYYESDGYGSDYTYTAEDFRWMEFIDQLERDEEEQLRQQYESDSGSDYFIY